MAEILEDHFEGWRDLRTTDDNGLRQRFESRFGINRQKIRVEETLRDNERRNEPGSLFDGYEDDDE